MNDDKLLWLSLIITLSYVINLVDLNRGFSTVRNNDVIALIFLDGRCKYQGNVLFSSRSTHFDLTRSAATAWLDCLVHMNSIDLHTGRAFDCKFALTIQVVFLRNFPRC